MKKTVVELDLAGYSDIARSIQENVSVEMVAHLNARIQEFIDTGLAAVGVTREQTVKATTGDGAILFFDHAEQAHRFAQGVHDATRRHNATTKTDSAKRWFRIGASTGDIMFDDQAGEIAGITIANAVRIESGASIGCFLIDLATYDALPDDLKLLYGDLEQVSGKREEKFWVRRCHMIPGIPSPVRSDKPQDNSPKGQTINTVTASGKGSIAIGGNACKNTFITGNGNRRED